jgi:hypothetical protein
MSLLRKMNLGRRFVVLGMLALALVGFQLSLYVREANKLIESTATERSGVPVVEALMEAMRVTQMHRGVANAWLAGVGTTPAPFEAARADAAKTMPLLEKLAADDAVPQDLRKPLVAAVSEWKNLSTAVVAKSIEVADSRKRHTALIDGYIGLVETAADTYGLTLDPEAATYYMVISTVEYMPGLAESLGRLRAQGAEVLATKATVGADERVAVEVLVDRAAYFLQRADSTFMKAVSADPGLEKKIGGLREEAGKQMAAAVKLARAVLIAGERTQTVAEYRTAMNAAIEAQFKLSGRSMKSTACWKRVRAACAAPCIRCSLCSGC